MKVALIQTCAGDLKSENIKRALSLVEKAIKNHAQFILLPEVFTFRGSLQEQLASISEDLPGETHASLMVLARKNKVSILAGSIFEKIPKQKKVYNTSALIDEKGKLKGVYRKINLFKANVGAKKFSETNHFLPGNELVLSTVKEFRVGLAICYDLRFPELFWQYGRAKVDMICIPSAFTYPTGKAHWEVLLRARAIENLCYILAPNQFGEDSRGVRNYGNSMVIDPWGNIIARASTDKEEIIYADINKKEIQMRRKILPGIAGK
jgi:deaminated glutathione amidase